MEKLQHTLKKKKMVRTRGGWYPNLLVEEANKHIETTYKRSELLD